LQEYKILPFEQPLPQRRLAQCEQERRELDFILITAGAGTWKWNPDTDIVEVSGHLRELLGYGGMARAATLDHWLGHVHPDDRGTIRSGLEAARDAGAAPLEAELRLLAQDGSARWFAMRADWQPQDSSIGRLLLGACVDVDALKAAEAARVRTDAELLRARGRFFHILDQMPSGVVLADVQSGALTYRNRAAAALLDAEGDDLGTRLHFAGVDFADEEGAPVAPHELPLARTLSHGEALERDLVARHRDGGQVAVAVNSDLVRDSDGTARMAVAVLHDISERKRVALQLATEKEMAQVTLAAIADGVIVTDGDGAITQMNPAAERLLEKCTKMVQGQTVGAVVRFEEQDAADALAAAIVDCQGERRTISDLPHATLHGPDGRRCAVECAVAPIALPDGSVAGAVLVLHDVTEAKRLLRRLGFEASHDALTGLVNRREFEARLQRAIEHACQPGGAPCALLYLDLDQFKVVNDTCGHAAGDELLRQLAGLYASHVRERDTLARIGGDEFAMIVEHCDLPEALAVADKILDTTRSFRFSCKERVFQPGVSIGLAPVDRTTASVEEAMRRADHACYIAKERGRNRVCVHAQADGELAQRRSDIHWVTRLGHAFQHDQLELYCQPIAALGGGAPQLHYEILLRMNDGAGAPISPGAFLPAAERYDVILRIDRWVLARTLGWLADHPEHLAGLDMCSINLSRRSLGDASFHQYAADLIENSAVPAAKLCFEITENGAIADMQKTIAFIERLAARGCRFSLDDFGTGMTSFACLKALPVDYIKIDGSLIQAMLSSEVDYEMVRFTNDISHRMGRKTIAEYVTDPALAEHLGRIGVDFAQGYFIGEPRPLAAAGASSSAWVPAFAGTTR
jgi:diguanylate cyclase (GGDEF)-like protein/PAS domain S-box-containing protein